VKKIKVRLPASLTDFSPGLQTIGLAISLYLQVDFIPRSDTQLILETSGEGADAYPLDLQHPVIMGMMRIFQKCERAPTGFTVRVNNSIPLNVGLGAESAFYVAGIIGANNLVGIPFRREELVEIVSEVAPVASAGITSMLGGLTGYFSDDRGIYFRQLPVEPFKLLIAIPQIENYVKPALPETVKTVDAIHNLQRLPVFLDALATGDLTLLSRVINDAIYAPSVQSQIEDYDAIANSARENGALAVTPAGGGTAIVFFLEDNHDEFAKQLEETHSLRTMVLPVDTQGIVISMMQMSS